MKATPTRFIALLLGASLLPGFNSLAFSRNLSRLDAVPVQQVDQASAALKEGRRLVTSPSVWWPSSARRA